MWVALVGVFLVSLIVPFGLALMTSKKETPKKDAPKEKKERAKKVD